jgi:integrase
VAEGVGFEPTLGLLLSLISSQVPLTTQPPFQPFIYKHLTGFRHRQLDILILQYDTVGMKHKIAQQNQPDDQKSSWQKTPFANLIRYAPSGKYFARIRVGGKLIRQSLKTKALSVAKLKLADLEKQERAKLEGQKRLTEGVAFFRDLAKEYLERLDGMPNLKPRTKEYYKERLAAMRKNWSGLDDMDARKLTESDCRQWASRYAKQASPTNYNNTLIVLRAILAIAVEQGIRYSNPAEKLKRVRVNRKELTLPSQKQFRELIREIRRVPFGPGLASADLVEFLAYTGLRVKSEAAHVTWADCDFDRGEIIVRGNPKTGTKNSEPRRVPMIPDCKRLLEHLRSKRPNEKPDVLVMRVRECQGAINRACKALGIARFTHHDLRHLFATSCIESGVDIPTVSRWLGHKDGGALAMRVYGHLRDSHSAEMAQKVRFLENQPLAA